jgi:hypothetical protein
MQNGDNTQYHDHPIQPISFMTTKIIVSHIPIENKMRSIIPATFANADM